AWATSDGTCMDAAALRRASARRCTRRASSLSCRRLRRESDSRRAPATNIAALLRYVPAPAAGAQSRELARTPTSAVPRAPRRAGVWGRSGISLLAPFDQVVRQLGGGRRSLRRAFRATATYCHDSAADAHLHLEPGVVGGPSAGGDSVGRRPEAARLHSFLQI